MSHPSQPESLQSLLRSSLLVLLIPGDCFFRGQCAKKGLSRQLHEVPVFSQSHLGTTMVFRSRAAHPPFLFTQLETPNVFLFHSYCGGLKPFPFRPQICKNKRENLYCRGENMAIAPCLPSIILRHVRYFASSPLATATQA